MPSRNTSGGPSKRRGGSSRGFNDASGSDKSGKSDSRPFKKSSSQGDRNEKRSGSPRPSNSAGRSKDGKSDNNPFKKPFGKGDRNERHSGPPRRFNDAGGTDRNTSDNRPFKKPFGKGDRNERSSGPPRRFNDAGGSDRSERRPFKKSSGRGDGNASRSGSTRPFNDARSRDAGKSDSRPLRKSSGKRPRIDEGKEPFRGKPFSKEGKEGSKPFKRFSKGDRKEGEQRSEKSYTSRAGSQTRKRQDEGEQRPRFEKQHVRKKTIDKNFSKDVTKSEEGTSSAGKIRLNKFIANSGVCSRREADGLITMGLITVNGVTITELGHKVTYSDEVKHEGKLLRAEKHVYILMNKPKGFLTTTADPQERNTVMHLISNFVKERVYPVGRLDRNTTGLLLLTNDGDLAEKLMHPSYNVKKIYKVELDRPLTKGDAQKIVDGVRLEEGVAMVDDLAIISDDKRTVGLEIHIGWNRVVRRIFETLEYAVLKLDRTSYAGLTKKELGRGEWRFLKKEELVVLKHLQ